MRSLARAAALAPADFFAGVRKGLRARLPADLRGFELMRGHSRLLKLHYGHPDLHFEPWDRGWSRLYETLPAPVLDERVMASGIDLMHEYITTLQPLVMRFLDEAA